MQAPRSTFSNFTDLGVPVAALPVDRSLSGRKRQHDGSACWRITFEHFHITAPHNVGAPGGKDARSGFGLVLVVACGVEHLTLIDDVRRHDASESMPLSVEML